MYLWASARINKSNRRDGVVFLEWFPLFIRMDVCADGLLLLLFSNFQKYFQVIILFFLLIESHAIRFDLVVDVVFPSICVPVHSCLILPMGHFHLTMMICFWCEWVRMNVCPLCHWLLAYFSKIVGERESMISIMTISWWLKTRDTTQMQENRNKTKQNETRRKKEQQLTKKGIYYKS